MRSFKSSLLCVTVLSVLLSCAQSKQLTEMHDTTAEMNKTTQDLNAKTGEMGATTKDMRDQMKEMKAATDEMRGKLDDMKTATDRMQQTTDGVRRTSETMAHTTCELYDVSKQGGGAGIRREAFERMLESISLGKKVDQAAQYHMAFEFQLWSAGCEDTPERRLELMNDGVREFFKAIQEVMDFTAVLDGSLDIDPLAGQKFQGRNSADNHKATMNALSAAMSEPNRKQLPPLAKFPGMKVVTIYTMIQEALSKQRALEEGAITVESLPAYQQEVLENREIAVKLLHARYNTLLAVFLEKTRPKGGWNLQTYLAASKTSWIGRMVKIPWKLEMDRLNPVQVEKYRQYLDWAADTREFLKSIGEKPVLNVAVGSMMKSIELVGHKQPTALAVGAQVKLQEAIDRINLGTGVPAAGTAAATAQVPAQAQTQAARTNTATGEQTGAPSAVSAGDQVAAPAAPTAKSGLWQRLKNKLRKLVSKKPAAAPAPAAAAPTTEAPVTSAAPTADAPAKPAMTTLREAQDMVPGP